VRGELERASIAVVGEFHTLGAARRAHLDADALVLAEVTDSGAGDPDDAPEVERLTPRELEVLEQLAAGLSNRQIAERLAISPDTVKFHLASISGKLAAVNRTDIVRRAVRRGLIAL
jgi:DNA-binding NarL/FixJ family response regulator